jgi:hypothetical protein
VDAAHEDVVAEIEDKGVVGEEVPRGKDGMAMPRGASCRM